MINKLNFLLFVTLSTSQVVSDYFYTGVESAGLAGAVVANPGGEWSLFHNPAGLAEQTSPAVIVGHSELYGLSFLPYSYLGFIFTNNKYWNLGVSFEQSSVTVGNKIELSNEQSIGITTAHYLQKDVNSKLIFGYRLNVMNWKLGHSAGVSGDGSDGISLGTATAFGLDIGFQAVLREKHRVGVEVQNINSPVIGEGISNQHLPRRMVMGIAYSPYTGFTTSLAMNRTLGLPLLIMGGIEYQFSPLFLIRIGAQSKPSRLGGGFTLSLDAAEISYSILSHHLLPVTHQFSIGYKFTK